MINMKFKSALADYTSHYVIINKLFKLSKTTYSKFAFLKIIDPKHYHNIIVEINEGEQV